MKRAHVFLIDADEVAEAAFKVSRAERHEIATRIGESIFDHCLGPLDPLVEREIPTLELGKSKDALRVVARWVGGTTRVLMWYRSEKRQLRVSAMRKLSEHHFQLLQRLVIQEIKERRERGN